MMMRSFVDPTFSAASRELAMLAQAAIIEWLRAGAAVKMPPLPGGPLRKRKAVAAERRRRVAPPRDARPS